MSISVAIDPDAASLDAMVTAVSRLDAAVAALQAMRANVLTEAFYLAERRAAGQPARVKARDMELRDISAEIGAAARVSDRAVQGQISDALTLTERFSPAHAALAAGEISLAHARVIIDAGCGIDDDVARDVFTHRAVEIARHETAGRLRGFVAPLAEVALPQNITERHQVARENRMVSLRDLTDGMCELTAVLPSALGKGIHDRLTRIGVAMKKSRRPVSVSEADVKNKTVGHISGETCETALVTRQEPEDLRTIDHLRADLLCDMLLSATPATCDDGLGSITAHIEVTVPAFTLAGLSDAGAELAGGVPIDADTARLLAGGATGWDRVLTHPASGAVLAVDRYRPTADIRRALRARDRRCRFAGCTRLVQNTDADHIIDAALGGETSLDNLCLECRRHHSMKHCTPWQVTHLGHGVIEWRSPLGRVYRDEPPRTVAFTPTSLETWLERASARPAPSAEPAPF